MSVVAASFVANDGQAYVGYVTPDIEDELGTLQPTIVTRGDQVGFWLGHHHPDVRGTIDTAYAVLGSSPSQLFPLRFQSDVKTPPGWAASGVLHGFMQLSDDGAMDAQLLQ